ncbi:MAG: hypothetical protein Q9192_007641, partial [Flavoplaca navasiana]
IFAARGGEAGVCEGAEDAREARDGGRGIFAAEEGTEDWEAGGEDTDVAFDDDPDADPDGGVGCVGDLKFGEEGDADDAGYANTRWSKSPRYRQYQDDEISDDVDGCDCVAHDVIINAVAVWDRSIPVIGERLAVEKSCEHQANPPENRDYPSGKRHNVEGPVGEETVVEEEDRQFRGGDGAAKEDLSRYVCLKLKN